MLGCLRKHHQDTNRLITNRTGTGDLITTDLRPMFTVPYYPRTERRSFIRLPYETEARGVASDTREGIVRVRNVSRIGLRLDVPCELAEGSPISLYFGDVYLNDAPINLEGRVIWTRPAGIWHETGIVVDHIGHQTVAATSELFYAALNGVDHQFEANYTPVSQK